MFKALIGGGRSSTDLRSSSSSKSGSRRKSGHRSSASSTVSRKSSRGDDRDRGLGDLSSYPSSSGSRSKRYAESAADESVASSYATAQPNYSDDRILIERTPKRRETDYDDGDDRYRDDRDRERRRERERARPDREESRDRDSRRQERERTHSGDTYASGAVPAPAPYGSIPTTQDHSQSPFPVTPVSGSVDAPSPSIYDPHVQQQFPGQFQSSSTEPYRPPNPAGEAADYYNDQGQSVADQPGIRPKPPLVIPNSQAHLMTASPSANPPPEPSSVGGVGAAADYYTDEPGHGAQPIYGSESRPPKPSKPSRPSIPAAAAATYGVGSYSSEQIFTESPAAYAPPVSAYNNKPPQSNSHSHGVGTAVGAAAAGAAAGYMLSHHHNSSSSSDHVSQYTMQNPDDISQVGVGHSGAPVNPALYAAGAAGVAGAAYAASPLHPHHAAIYHGSPFQGGAMAFQQRQRGPLDKFIDFWRDPEGVGKFEDYTEAIGVCKYCFEPGTTSKNAPRPHHYRRRRSSDRIRVGSRVDKLNRYASSEDEGRRHKSTKSSWIPAILGGYAVKSLFDNRVFDDSYSVKSGRVAGAYPDSESTSASDKRSRTSRGEYKRSNRSDSQDRTHRVDHHDLKPSRYDGARITARPRSRSPSHSRSRSRSRSSSKSKSHTLRDAAIGAAIGTAAVSVAKSRHRDRSRSPSPSRPSRKSRGRKSSSSDSSIDNISRPAKTAVGGFGSFFSASSENRKKRKNKRSRSIFSFNNSSSSSLDNDLAFGSGYAKKLLGKSRRRSSKEKKEEKDVDAKLLALGATATALAASSPRRNRRAGEVFVGQGSRSGRSDNTSSASNDGGWEDMDSGEASSVSSALAFGPSDQFARANSHSSDSSSSGWGWGWGAKSKKKKEKKRRSKSPEHHIATGAAVVAGALGTAALASGYHRDAKPPSQPPSSAESLQHVAPMPTSDPSRFEAIPVSAFPPEPQLVRPGPIPLQQPQPVTPVSQAVYTTQGAPYSAPIIPAFESPFPSYEAQVRDVQDNQWEQKSSVYPQRVTELPNDERRHRRSDSTPIFQTDPLDSAPDLGLKRRSTTRDQASVQFDLTKEQEDKQRRAEHLERLKRDVEREHRIQLIDAEEVAPPSTTGYVSERRDREAERERERQREKEREKERDRERDLERQRDLEGQREQERRVRDDLERDRESSSWVGAIAAGAIGAAAASTVLSGRSSKDDASDMSDRRRERREQRRAERRRTDPTAVSTVLSDLPGRPKPQEILEERASSTSPFDHVKTTAFRGVGRKKSVYDDYATFFYPEELRHSPDSHTRRETPIMPTIVEIEPASETFKEKLEDLPSTYQGLDRLPWPVPTLNVIEPTPPHSINGSVRDAASPIITPSEPPEEEKEPERPTASRVSWGEHQTHEYEVPSTSSERSSLDLNEHQRDFTSEPTVQDTPIGYTYIRPSADDAEESHEEIEFAATVAAAAQAAGFDPSLVTDDPIFRTRTSPPGSDTRERSISPGTKAPRHPEHFHGFVEGEVTSPSAPQSQFFTDQPIFTDSAPAVFKAPIYPRKPVFEPIEQVTEPLVREVPRGVEVKDVQDKPPQERRQDSESPGEEEFFMPGGFESEEPKAKSTVTEPVVEDTTRSTAPYYETREPEPLKRSETDDTEADFNDYPGSTIADEDGSEGKKKKRRKRRSKRESDTFDDTASVSSVLTADSDKRKSTDDKGKKSGGFLSSIFGSRVSEPVESKRSPEKPVSREVQSEVGPRTSGESTRRRRHRSSSRGDSLDGRRRYDDDLDREDSLTADKENINVESYKSSRQRREDRRKQRYGDAAGLGESAEYEKDSRTSQDSDRDQSFLVERPEMPPIDNDGDYDGVSGPSSLDAEGRGLGLGFISRRPRSHSTSPPSSQKIVTDSAPRSVSPGPTEDGTSRPRRPSVLRFADSPTAVPLHFRPPPTSPRLQRAPSITSPTSQTPIVAPIPTSPSQGRRSRPNSSEFKTSREIRPLFLVERHTPSKINNQFDEPLPSLPSSKSGSEEDLTALHDEYFWESPSPELVRSVHAEARQPGAANEYYNPKEEIPVLGSQQNTPTRATFAGIPRHLSRKDELGYEFHSPSELLVEDDSYPGLPPSPTLLPSIEGSFIGIGTRDGVYDNLEKDLESLPPLPDSRPSTPEETVIPTELDEEQQRTPTQAPTTALPLEKDIPETDLYSGPSFVGVVDAAIAASNPYLEPTSSDAEPETDTDTLATSQSQYYDFEDDDDGARTVTGDDVQTITDLSPPRSPTIEKGHESSVDRAAPWGLGFASVVGAALAVNNERGDTAAVEGDFLVTSPGEKQVDDIVDTTEDEFFDASGSPAASLSRDELADDFDYEEARRVLALPTGIKQIDIPATEEGAKDSKLDLESEAELKPEEPSFTEKGPAPDAQELEDKPTDTPVQKPAEDAEPTNPFSTKKNKKKKKKKGGTSVDLSEPVEKKALETLVSEAVSEPEPDLFSQLTETMESERDLLVEETKPSEDVQVISVIKSEETPGLVPEELVAPEQASETVPVPEQLPTIDTDKPSETEPQASTLDVLAAEEITPFEETRSISLEESLPTEQSPTVLDAVTVPEATAPSHEQQAELAQPAQPEQAEETEDTPGETGLSKKAKKKKKKKSKAAAAAEEPVVAEEAAHAEGVPARPEDTPAAVPESVGPEISTETTEATRSIEDVAQSAEQGEAVPQEPEQASEIVTPLVSVETTLPEEPADHGSEAKEHTEEQAAVVPHLKFEAQDAPTDAAPASDEISQETQDPHADKELDAQENDNTAAFTDNLLEAEPSLPTVEQEPSAERELVDPAVVGPTTEPEQRLEELVPGVQAETDKGESATRETVEPTIGPPESEREVEADSVAVDPAVEPVQAESTELKPEEEAPQEMEPEPSLSRKASKKKNKKNKRKSVVEAEPTIEPESADPPQPGPEPETQEQVAAESVLGNEPREQEDKEALVEAVQDEEPVSGPVPAAVDDSLPGTSDKEQQEIEAQPVLAGEDSKTEEQQDIPVVDRAISEAIEQVATEEPASATVPETAEDPTPEEPADTQTKKKNKKKKNRKSAVLSEPEPEPEPEAQPEPKLEPETQPEDSPAPPQTSGQVPPLEDNEHQQQEDAGTALEPTEIQTLDPIPNDNLDPEPNQAVENAEHKANDSEPHVPQPEPEQQTSAPTEPEAGEPSSTIGEERKDKKNKKKKNKQSGTVTPVESESLPLPADDVVETPAPAPQPETETQIETSTPVTEEATDATPDVDVPAEVQVESPAVPEDSSIIPPPEPEEAMSRDFPEPPAEAEDASSLPTDDHVQPDSEVSMTAAQKKKAKKDRKKKRQSLAVEEPQALDAPAPAEAEANVKEPDVKADSGAEQLEITAPVTAEEPSERVEEEVKESLQEQDSSREQSAPEKAPAQLEEASAVDLTVAAEETPATEAAESVHETSQDEPLVPATEELSATDTLPSSKPQVDEVPEGQAPVTLEVSTQPTTELTPLVEAEKEENTAVPAVETLQDAAVELVEEIQEQKLEEPEAATATESVPETPTQDIQPASSSKKDKKKKKKKNKQSVSVDEPVAEAEGEAKAEPDTAPELLREDDIPEAPVVAADLSTTDVPATNDEAAVETVVEPEIAAEQLRDSEKPQEISDPVELAPEPPVEPEEPTSLEPAKETTSEEPITQQEDITPAPVDQEPIQTSFEDSTLASTEPQQEDQPAEEPLSSSSKKKNKKKKKKSQSASLDEGASTPTTEDPATLEKPAEPITETAVTAEPEEITPIVLAEESQPLAPEADLETFTTESKEAEAQVVEDPPTQIEEGVTTTSKKKAKKDQKKRKSVSFATGEELEQPAEPSEAVGPAKQTEATAEPATTDSDSKPEEGLKEVETPPEYIPAPSEPVTETEPERTIDKTDLISSEPEVQERETQLELSSELPPFSAPEASLASEETLKDEEVLEELLKDEVEVSEPREEQIATLEDEPAAAPDQTLEHPEPEVASEPAPQPEIAVYLPVEETPENTEPETASSKKKDKKKKKRKTLDLKEDEPVASTEPSAENPLGETVQEETETIPATPVEEPVAKPVAESIPEPLAEPVEEPIPEPEKQEDEPLSAKAKKKAKKDKKRQSKLLALENDKETDASPSIQNPSENTAQEPAEPSTEEATLKEPTSEEQPAEPETALSPAEEDGKEHQSHDTESHAATDKDLTWTDNDVSSQVEKEQQEQQTVSAATIEIERSGEAGEGVVIGEGSQATTEIKPEVVDEEVVKDEDVAEAVEVPSLSLESGKDTEQAQDKDVSTEAEQSDIISTPIIPGTAEPAEEHKEEEALVSELTVETDPVAIQEAEPEQPPANDEGDAVAPEPEPAALSRKLSKKQKKKQRQAEKAAEQEQEKDTAPEEPILREKEEAMEATLEDIQEPIEVSNTDTPALPSEESGAREVAEEAVVEAEKSLEHPSGPLISDIKEAVSEPLVEEVVQQADSEFPTATEEPAAVELDTQQDRSLVISTETIHDVEPFASSHLVPLEETAAEDQPLAIEPPAEDTLVPEDKPEEPSSSKSRKKNKKNKKKAAALEAEAAEVGASEESVVVAETPEPVKAEVIEEAPKDETVDPTPLEAIESQEQPIVSTDVEETRQSQMPEPEIPETTIDEDQPKALLEAEVEAPLEDKLADEPSVVPETIEEPTLSRRESKKKKKKAKKSAKEQLDKEEEGDAVVPVVPESENVTEQPAVEALPVPAEATEAQPAVEEPIAEAAALIESERELDIPQKELAHQEVEVKEDVVDEKEKEPELVETSLGVMAETARELEVPIGTPVQEERVTRGVEKEILPEEKPLEQDITTEPAEPVVEKNTLELATDDAIQATEPVPVPEPEAEPTPLPLSRKPSKKEKKKLKKQAESGALEAEKQQRVEESTEPVEPFEPAKDEITISQPEAANEEIKEETAIPSEMVEPLEATKELEPESEPIAAQDNDIETARDIQEERNPAVEEPKNRDTEPSTVEDPSLSRKLSKKEKKKKRKGGKVEEPPEPDPPAEPAIVEETVVKALAEEPHDDELTPRPDEDAWPPIDWAKGKIDAIDQSSQSSVEAHAAPFLPEIPDFKESAIPEALLERPGESPEEAAKESKAQAMIGTIEREVTTWDFDTTSADSALQKLHDAETTGEKPAAESISSKIAIIFPNLERGLFRRPSPSQSVKDGAEEETMEQTSRDSAIQVLEAPVFREVDEQEVRDGGYIPSPAFAQDDVFGPSSGLQDTQPELVLKSPPEPFEAKSRSLTHDLPEPAERDDVFGITTRDLPSLQTDFTRGRSEIPIQSRSLGQDTAESASTCELRRSPSIHGRHDHPRLPWSLDEPAKTNTRDISPRPLDVIAQQGPERAMVRNGTPRLEMKPEHVLPRPETPTRKFTETALGRRAWPTSENGSDDDWEKVQKPSPQRLSPERGSRSEILRTPEQDKPLLRPSRPGSNTSSTHSLRRGVHSASGDLRAAAAALAASEAPEGERQSRPTTPQPPSRAPTDLNVERIASSSSYDPVTDKGKKPARTMTDVYEGWGETPSSPRSPSRPPSVRHRRSMQHLQELEFRLDHLISENRDLAAARDAAEDKLRNASLARRKSDHALNTRAADLRDREAELEQLRQSVEWFQKEVARLSDENTGLTTTNATLIATHTQEIQEVQQTAMRDVEHLRSQNERLSVDLHERIKQEIETALGQKNAELRRLREELESARDKVKELQEQISASMNDNVIAFRGEDYFEAACQKLCGHVQQWVLRFSKHSDSRRCRKLIDIQDEKIADRFDNAILDGSDTDSYLGDRVRRRDVFMSVVMSMIWEFVFTRYLFGMDREQRQKLKSLEKQLIEVGPRNSIHRWRATTLTLLSRRAAFTKQRESDTEAVTLEIFETLSRLLPPPAHVESQLLDSLRKVLRVAVNLSIEMRTQLAEFIMLPPLQPEYDTNGDLARQVYFNAALMNERSGETTSNDELQAQNAIVRVVLFPLVVKKGNDAGEGDEEVVVCPAQVLVARPGKDKRLNRMTSGDRMSVEASRSVHSIAPSTMDMSMNMSMSNVI